MASELVVVDGSTFFRSDAAGDIGGGDDGLFFADARHLSTWRLQINGDSTRVLTCDVPQYYSARITSVLGGTRPGVNPTMTIRRDRIVASGMHEDITVENHSNAPIEVRVELHYGADFADLFEVKDGDVRQRRVHTELGEDRVVHRYETDGFARSTTLEFSLPGKLGRSSARWDVSLAARECWSVCVDVVFGEGDQEHAPRAGHGGFGQLEPQMPMSLEEWIEDAPRIETDLDGVDASYSRTLHDLAALRFQPFDGRDWSLPAAGSPWFMALFGRDSIVTAYQALPFQPQLARTTLEALAALQATTVDDFRDADPGKILHELRHGESAVLGTLPHSPYYGAHDVTLLFLVLLEEYERWTADSELVRHLEPVARAALAWMEGPADLDGDGYLEYETRSREGLPNQCWKDSGNSMLFADGRQAEAPIATCEIQGYAYDARMRTARLAREIWDDAALADRLEADAAALKDRFNRDFWVRERGHFALALDRDKQQVDAATSNLGHLLWSGIVNDAHAAATGDRLLAEDLHSGWGVRTMSADDVGYNPIEYHNGTVWPHDTGIVAEGLRRYGRRDEAAALALTLLEASTRFEHRLPEVFAGFSREPHSKPVEYPTASRPQAWASGAVLLALRTVLGLDADAEGLRADPASAVVGRLRLTGVQIRGGRGAAG